MCITYIAFIAENCLKNIAVAICYDKGKSLWNGEKKKKKEKKLTTNTENDFVVFNAQCLMYNISHTYCVVLIRNNKKSEKTTPTTKKKKRE